MILKDGADTLKFPFFYFVVVVCILRKNCDIAGWEWVWQVAFVPLLEAVTEAGKKWPTCHHMPCPAPNLLYFLSFFLDFAVDANQNTYALPTVFTF